MTERDVEEIAREAASLIYMADDPDVFSSAEYVIAAAIRSERAARQKAETFAERLEAAWFMDEQFQLDGTLRANLRTTVDRANAAEAERDRLSRRVEDLEKALREIGTMPWPDSESPYALIARRALSGADQEVK